MLEFHARDFLILVANFLILLGALNYLLFKPLAQIFKEREAATKGALEEAKALTVRKDNSVAAMNAELTEARTKAKTSQNKLRDEGLATQKETMSKAEAEAVQMIEKARKELQAEAEKARAALKADVETFSEEIIRKLVKI
ncbi:MAG TPA: ATP synthase F0 subunit B [Dissulfurispiraceae bacterium]|nr:ATP synthase F0 subunit B [Dissulfurispiraceae bacterium]